MDLIAVPRYRKWVWCPCSFCASRIACMYQRRYPDGSYERTHVCPGCGTAETYRAW